MKYLIMECHDNYAVALDETAGFVNVANIGYEVGETIENPEVLQSAPTHRSIIMKVAYGVAAAAACLVAVVGIGHYNEYLKAYSSIRLSINPDVQMELNRHGQVLSVEALNEDGEILLEGYKPDRQDKTEVADDLIERAIEMGFLSSGATIVFEIDTPDEAMLTEYSIELRSDVEDYLSNFDDVQVIIAKYGDDIPDSDYGYDDDDYDPIVIPIPEQSQTLTATTVPPTQTTTTAHPGSDSDYKETTSNSESDYGDTSDSGSDYAPIQTTTAAASTTTTTTRTTVTAPTGDSSYDSDSSYGDSAYQSSNDSAYDDADD